MSFHIDETIQSQYSTSPRLMALIRGLYKVLYPAQDLDMLYKRLFDVDTATGPCLDVWGRITGIPRTGQMVTAIGVPHFGFDSGMDDSDTGFNQAPFYHGAEETRIKLSDDAYRLYIKTKAAANITTGSLAELNALIAALLPGCDVSLTRTAPMHLSLVVSGDLKDYQHNMLLQGDLPPIPAGVSIDITVNHARYFGFNSEANTGFNNGPFSRD